MKKIEALLASAQVLCFLNEPALAAVKIIAARAILQRLKGAV